MKVPKSVVAEYFKRSVVYLSKSKILFFIVSIIEYSDLLSILIDCTGFIFRSNEKCAVGQQNLTNILLKISPYQYWYNYMSSENYEGFHRNYIALIIYCMLFFGFLFFLFNLSEYDSEKIGNYMHYILTIFINFYDYIYFRILPFYGIDVLAREIMRITSSKSYTNFDIFILLFCFCCIIGSSILQYTFFTKICVWSNFKLIDSYFNLYPYDIFLSSKIDTAFYTVKVVLVLITNYLSFNGNNIDKIVLFLSVLAISIIFIFFSYCAFIFFISENGIFICITFHNQFRIFFLLFIFESTLLRIILHAEDDYIPFLVYEMVLLVFNVYLVFAIFYNHIYSKALKSQNTLAVCWFVQANDLDINQFLTDWISNHRTGCNILFCPICALLRKEIDVFEEKYSNEYLNKKEIANFFNNLENNKEKDKTKRKNLRRNLASRIYTPYNFCSNLIKMAEKEKYLYNEDDLIRLDYLHLLVLFLAEENVEFLLYNTICFYILKYRDNVSVSVSFILLFNVIRKLNADVVKGYDIIKINENLRLSLKDYIKYLEDFLFFTEKNPVNYVDISEKFTSFKEQIKDIHLIFKKNSECNYQILLMRYAYENLLRVQFKNSQAFDLNYYSDFLEYHYEHDKEFLISYNIIQDNFKIVKGSKEILKYQGKNLSTVFPEEFQEIGIEKLKNQLLNKEQNKIKPIFEFISNNFLENSNLNFIDSFKMKFYIYPTEKMNELFISGYYLVGFADIIIFKKIDNKELLYSFSYQIYKFLACTPNIIALLFSNKKYIFLEDILTKEINSNKDSNIYNFSFVKYLPLYSKIINNDIIKYLDNYQEIQEKYKLIQQYASEKKDFSFSLTKKWEYSIASSTYIIYNIKELKKKNEKTVKQKFLLQTGTQGTSGSKTSLVEKDEFENANQFILKGMNTGAPVLSSGSLTNFSEGDKTSNLKSKKEEKQEDRNKPSKNLKRYSTIILGMSLLLSILTLIFLILEVNLNKNFQSLFSLFQNFKLFKRGIESAPLNVLSNFNFWIGENKSSVNIYELYSYDIGLKYPKLSKLNMSEVVMFEIEAKFNQIINFFDTYQKSIYGLGSTVSDKITSLSSNSYTMSVENKNIILYSEKLTFTAMCRQYVNYLSTLIENNAYTKENFELLSFEEEKNGNIRVNMHHYSEMTQIKKNMILLIIEYPFMHEGLKETSNIIQEQFQNSLNSIEKIAIIFFVLLMVFHFLLLLIVIIFLFAFVKILKIDLINANNLLADRKYLRMHEKRIEQFKLINDLYCENPLKTMKTIDSIEDFYKRKVKEDSAPIKNSLKNIDESLDEKVQDDNSSLKSQTSKMQEKVDKQKIKKSLSKTLENLGEFGSKNKNKGNYGINKNDQNSLLNLNNDINNDININSFTIKKLKINYKHFKPIIKRFEIILLFAFLFYYIYNAVFFIIVLEYKGKLNNLVKYCNSNYEIDGYVYDNINVLIYLYVTNSSSEFYGKMIEGNENIDYLSNGINGFFESIKEKENLESSYSNLFPKIGNEVNINCSKGIIEDSYVKEACSKANVDYKSYLNSVCELFPVASTSNDNMMLREISYKSDQLFRKYTTVETFELIYEKYLNQFDLFELFTLVLFFNRPIRTYFNSNIFPNESDSIFSSFYQFFFVYLLINVFLDLLIFIALNFAILADIRGIYKKILSFISSLKF